MSLHLTHGVSLLAERDDEKKISRNAPEVMSSFNVNRFFFRANDIVGEL